MTFESLLHDVVRQKKKRLHNINVTGSHAQYVGQPDILSI